KVRVAFEFVDTIYGANVWMVQCRCGACFALKPLARSYIPLHLRTEELQRSIPAEPSIRGTIHDPHAAKADPFDNPIWANLLANPRICCRRLSVVRVNIFSLRLKEFTGCIVGSQQRFHFV